MKSKSLKSKVQGPKPKAVRALTSQGGGPGIGHRTWNIEGGSEGSPKRAGCKKCYEGPANKGDFVIHIGYSPLCLSLRSGIRLAGGNDGGLEFCKMKAAEALQARVRGGGGLAAIGCSLPRPGRKQIEVQRQPGEAEFAERTLPRSRRAADRYRHTKLHRGSGQALRAALRPSGRERGGPCDSTATGKPSTSQVIASCSGVFLLCSSCVALVLLLFSPSSLSPPRVLLRHPNGAAAVALSSFDMAAAEMFRRN